MAVVLEEMGEAAPVDARPPTPLPVEFRYLWDIWKDLNSERSSSGFGANPIQSRDIVAWCDLHQHPLEPWEARAIRAVENAFMQHQVDKAAPAAPGG